MSQESTRATTAPDDQHDALQFRAVSKMDRTDLEAEVLRLRAESDRRAVPVPDNTGRAENLALVIARLEQIQSAGLLDDTRQLAKEAIVCAQALAAREPAPVARDLPKLDAEAERLTVEQIVELADKSEWVDPESGREQFDRLGFAQAVERAVIEARGSGDKANSAPPADEIAVPRATLELIEAAMNHMGDQLNDMDVVEEDDEDECTPAFEAIRELLAPSAGSAGTQEPT